MQGESQRRETAIGIVGAAAVCCVMLLWALLGNPPYAFFGVMKWAVALTSAFGAWHLFSYNRFFLPLSLLLALNGGVHLFAKMHRAEWVLFNWAAIVLLIAMSFGVALLFIRRAQ